MASVVYNNAKLELLKGTFDLSADTIKAALVSSSYTPNIDTHTTYADITNEVANGNGYTTGGNTLDTPTATVDNTNDLAVFDAADETWSAASFTARGAVLYSTTNSNKLICYIDFGADKTSSGGDFTITFDTDGILTLA